MPLTPKGQKIMSAMQGEYGDRAPQVFYASRNKGTISGVDPQSMPRKKPKKKPQPQMSDGAMSNILDGRMKSIGKGTK